MRQAWWMLAMVALWPGLAAGAITRGPLLGDVTQGAITIRWITDQPSLGTVQFGLSLAALTGSASETGTPRTDHEVRLTGLAASTRYLYIVSSGPDMAAGAEQYFTTAPTACEPYRIAVFGDTRGATTFCDDLSDWAKVATMIDGQAPELVVGTGDYVYAGEKTSCWDHWFDAVPKLFKHTPFYPAMGNHDYDTQTYTDESNAGLLNAQRWFSLPTGPEVGKYTTYYAFSFGNARFIVYDTYKDHAPGSAQYQWIEAELAAAKADPNVQHSFVINHATFEGVGQFCFIGEQAQKDNRAWIEPLVQQYEADATFVGHEHNYVHVKKNGIHHVVTGGGGAPLENTIILPCDQHLCDNPDLVKFDQCTFHAMILDINGAHVTYTALAEDGTTVLDTWEEDHWATKVPVCLPPAPDGGTAGDAGPPPADAGAPPDAVVDAPAYDSAGNPLAAAGGGCCRVGARGGATGAVPLALLCLAALALRRRRR
ncbi:MAG TPA: metallophosphoesterase family protein [Polyangia bacterium]|jgi:hypothetical protein